MDISEIKSIFEKKTKSDNITREVKNKIKETIWEKQNQREGFTETFKPLISQFEDPGQDKDGKDKTKNIFTQNRDMLQNQLALSKKLQDNQKAITDGFKQFERLADIRELSGLEDEDEDEDENESEKNNNKKRIT